MKTFSTIDEYIDAAPEQSQLLLKALRQTIHKAAPEAGEKISYGVPTITFHGNLVHFGGFKDHIGFFPGSAGVTNFEKELSGYETSKGTIRFPLDKPLPLDLVAKITEFRVDQNLNKKKQ